jgi:hypothetical protein
MRMLLRWSAEPEPMNKALRSGRMAEINQWLPARTRPEAAYFGTEHGRRTGFLVFDLADSSQIPVIAEPLFQELHRSVEFLPVMNIDDLQRGLAGAAR